MKYFIFIVLAGLFIVNPFGLNGFWPLVFISPIVIYYIGKDNFFGSRSFENQFELEQKIDKWLKLIIQFLGILAIATSVGGFEIPFLHEIINIFKYLGDNLGVGSEALGVLVGIVVTIYGMIKEGFAVTKQISKRLVKDQYRKYEG